MRHMFLARIALMLLVGFPALAGPRLVQSPNQMLTFTLSDIDGTLTYRVDYIRKMLVAPSALGFRFADNPPLEHNLQIIEADLRTVDETWEQPWGEKRFVRNHYNELRATIEEQSGLGRRFYIVVRLYNDGLGFRYEFPKQDTLNDVKITDELTQFSLPAEATAWWIPGREWNRYEYLYNETPLSDVPLAHTPMTVKTETGVHVAIHEAALLDYAGMALKRGRPGVLEADLAPRSDGLKVVRQAPFETPWRTLQIADTAKSLLASDLILNLNEPNKLGDVSWVEPGKYIGIWWELHLATHTWGSGPNHGATTERVKRYLDFAAEHGFSGVLVEGWNIGWDGDWYNNPNLMRFAEPYPDFDMAYLSEYAQQKGVRIIGHHETSGGITNYENQLAEALDYYEDNGVRAVKTGYVADGGDVERTTEDGRVVKEWHDGQFMVNHYTRVVEEAAKRKISINTHEPIKDTGLRRTYPNWISREGARGMEYSAWGNPGNDPQHTTILPFTRMLSGPMDYTPGIFDLLFEEERPNNRIMTTLAKQLALYVVLYSPIQMAADLPENYLAKPGAFQFIKDVPADWSETVPVHGAVGDYVAIARKDRNSEDWYLGAVSDEKGRMLPTRFNFLDPGRTYTAQIYRDGPDAHWDDAPYDMVIEEKRVTASDSMTLYLAAGGGIAIRFTPRVVP